MAGKKAMVFEDEYFCYTCVQSCPLEEIRLVDQHFEKASEDEYVFLIDFLGLHHCSGQDYLFHQGITNVCRKCLSKALRVYKRSYKREYKKNLIQNLKA